VVDWAAYRQAARRRKEARVWRRSVRGQKRRIDLAPSFSFDEKLGQQILDYWFMCTMTMDAPPTVGQLFERLHKAVDDE
jgi:hypothetical protein